MNRRLRHRLTGNGMTRNNNWIRTAVVLLLTLCCGCTSIYNRKWERTTAQAGESYSPVGKWEGKWESVTTGHRGKLRCIVTDTDSADYEFHFWATWSLFAATWRLDLKTVSDEARTELRGEKNLGRLFGGIYSFEGTVEDDRFRADYRSSKDKGVLELNRVRE